MLMLENSMNIELVAVNEIEFGRYFFLMTNQADGKREGENRPPLNHRWMGHAPLSDPREWQAVRVTDGTVLLIATTCTRRDSSHCGDIEI